VAGSPNNAEPASAAARALALLALRLPDWRRSADRECFTC